MPVAGGVVKREQRVITRVLVPHRSVPILPAEVVNPLDRACQAGTAGLHSIRPPAPSRPLSVKREPQEVERPRPFPVPLGFRRADIGNQPRLIRV